MDIRYNNGIVFSQLALFDECEKVIYKAMYKYPHAAEPHNLLGIFLEKTGDHIEAMRHFRAACDLEPTYKPAEQNLIVFGTFCPGRKVCAFNIKDCESEKEGMAK